MFINILSLDFSLFSCKNCNPPEKDHPLFPPLKKLRSCQAPPFWKFGKRFNTPSQQKGGGSPCLHQGVINVSFAEDFYVRTRWVIPSKKVRNLAENAVRVSFERKVSMIPTQVAHYINLGHDCQKVGSRLFAFFKEAKNWVLLKESIVHSCRKNDWLHVSLFNLELN